MRLNKYQYLENKETYLLIVFFILSFLIRIPIIFLYGDTSLEIEWYLLVNSLAEHGTLSMKNFGDFFESETLVLHKSSKTNRIIKNKIKK